MHDVEMRVEGGDLVDLGLRHAQLRGECREMARREMAVAILDQVKIFDQQVAPTRHSSQKFFDFLNGGGLDLAPLWNRSGSPAARTGMARGSVIVRHSSIHLGQRSGFASAVRPRSSDLAKASMTRQRWHLCRPAAIDCPWSARAACLHQDVRRVACTCGPTGPDRDALAREFQRTHGGFAGVPPGSIVRPDL